MTPAPRRPTKHQLTLLRFLHTSTFGDSWWNPQYAVDIRAMEALERRGWLTPRKGRFYGWDTFTPEGRALAEAEVKRVRDEEYLAMIVSDHPKHYDTNEAAQCPRCKEEP